MQDDILTKIREEQRNVSVQTNSAWVFLMLCNRGISGKAMLEQGITKSMFLVACDPKFKQLRQLVICGFAILGRGTDELANEETSE